MKPIILASASPRRKKILEDANLNFKVIISGYNEDNTHHKDPKALVENHAIGKATDICSKIKNSIVIGVDTIVVINNQIIGKPKNRYDAKQILSKLSGNTHKVYTGYCIIDAESNHKIVNTVITHVTFKKLNDNDIEKYLDMDEYKDKAGSYAFQGKAKEMLIDNVAGSHTNILGLPIDEFLIDLKKFI